MRRLNWVFISVLLLLSWLLCYNSAMASTIIDQGEISENHGSFSRYDVYWELYDDGSLYLYGSGTMPALEGWTGIKTWKNKKDMIKHVYICAEFSNIGSSSFQGCSNMESIEFRYPASLRTIDRIAFSGCSSLVSITIPEGVTVIGDSSFSGCSSLKNIRIPDNVTKVSSNSFCNCISLESITLSSRLATIGESAFYGCSALQSINIPDGVTSIGIKTFFNCSNLERISLPKNLNSIGSYGFYNCGNMTSITIPDSVTSIGNYAFYECKNLRDIIIPDSVTSIGDFAFYSCKNLINITIPNSVTSIGNYAFYSCRNLANITIPNKLISIGDYTFGYCEKLTYITIPNSVTSIGDRAFVSCGNLTSITIPDGITNISDYAFVSCKNLEKVYFSIQDPDIEIFIGNHIFYNNTKLTVYCYMFTSPDTWCTQNNYTPIYLDEIDVNSIRTISIQDDFIMAYGDTQRLTAQVFPETGDQIVWSSNNPSVISIENDIATAHSAGSATITASVGAVSKSMIINVYTPATDFTLNSNEIWLAAKDSVQLSVLEFKPEGAEASISWTSSDESLASVNENGYVTTIKPGDVTIIATTEKGVSCECIIHLCNPVTTVTITPSSAKMYPGDMLPIIATATSKDESFENKLITFDSSDESIATINSQGQVMAVYPGYVIITASAYSGKSASCEITVCCREHTMMATAAKTTGCTESGNSAYWKCTVCNKYFSDAEGQTEIEENSWIIPAAGHTMTATVAKAATCTEPGNSAYWKCVACNKYFSDADGKMEIEENSWIIPEVGHTMTTTAAKAATCTESGNSTYWKCTTCNKYFSDADGKTEIEENSWIIPAAGHTMTATTAKDATCTEPGNSAYWKCTACNKYFSDADGKTEIEENSWIIPAVGHAMTEHVKVEATCTTAGTEAYWDCSVCNKLFSDKDATTEIEAPVVILAKGHDWDTPTYEWTNDNSEVTATRVCKHNAAHKETETKVTTRELIAAPTEKEAGVYQIVSKAFENPVFESQTKGGLVIRALENMNVLKLPAFLKTIETEAFEGVSAEAIIIPDECTTIEPKAFMNCKNLLYVRIPAGVEIPADAFAECPNVVIDQR